MSGDEHGGESLRQRIERLRSGSDYRVEQLVDTLAEEIVDRMVDLGLSRAQLADRLGVSPARVTKILRGANNFTVRTLVEIGAALECDLAITLVPHAAQCCAGAAAKPQSAQPGAAAEARAPYCSKRRTASYESRDSEIRHHLTSGKLKVETGVVLMRRERDGSYLRATTRRTGGSADYLRTNVGSRAYYVDRILAVAETIAPTNSNAGRA